ncbi:sensor histidine kinase [Undibacterium piscinae]|uniref:C4-dicarboxylate transport sensor protein DctB n=1 Tax=Undibacterium piscinae TaxID=2495591 RepID=A0A6M4A900_9BURK|nr:sensor histidine kinase [Undibacterium piscinae]
MRISRRIILFALVLGSALALIFSAYLLASRKAVEDIRLAGERQLQLIALDLESVLERYETLPYSVAYLPMATQVLAAPHDGALLQEFNLTLQDLQQQAKVESIYLMDKDGKTLASSNWDSATSYIGKNFGFRPYFAEAIKGSGMGGVAGHFYAIGNSTNIPGYFIAQAVYPSGSKRGLAKPLGVIAVKISLNTFEQAWRSSEEPIALADRHGVVFLSNRSAWQYRSLGALDQVVQQGLQQTLQYAGKRIVPINSLPKAERAGFDEYLAHPIGRLGWQLMLFPAQSKVQRAGAQAAAVASLLIGVLLALAGVVYQRRRRLEEGRAAQFALKHAADELEQKIAQRTLDLTLGNEKLEAQLHKLTEAENLLRTTQNDMLQTAKLAMLGQMAAGITHELNQPLTAIRAFADNAGVFLARGNSEQAGANLQHISDASARMGSIIGQLKGFARKSSDALSVVDVGAAIHAAAALLRSEFERQEAQLELQLESPLESPQGSQIGATAALVLGDSIRMEQVLINLIRNALDAVEQSRIKKVSVILECDADVVCIRIIDSGSGLPEQVLQHLFEPFFTTKPSGRGLGLGLAISSSIVQAMNGQLSAQNRAQGGAEFVVKIPAMPAALA